MNNLTQKELASRLLLNCLKRTITKIKVDHKCITVVDVFDKISLPSKMRDKVKSLLEGAYYCSIKRGGDFPYLANPQEFSMLIQVHLRKHEPDIESLDKKFVAKEKELVVETLDEEIPEKIEKLTFDADALKEAAELEKKQK
eukprot:UN04621